MIPFHASLITASDEWAERYRKELLRLEPAADKGWLDIDCDLVFQGRVSGETPERVAQGIANEIAGWRQALTAQ